MICMKCTAFCDLQADLRTRLATLRKSIYMQVLVLQTCVNLRVLLARALQQSLVATPHHPCYYPL